MRRSSLSRALLAVIVLAVAGVLAGPASAADGVKLGTGGFFKQTYMVTIDQGDHWGLTAGTAAINDPVGQQPGRDEQTDHPLGINLNLGNFDIGGIFGYRQDFRDQGPGAGDRWVAGIGAGYTIDAWSLGLQYSHLDQSGNTSASLDAFQQDRVTLTGNYALSPGIDLGGELGYSWVDINPEGGADGATKAEDYHALEIGIGTNFQF